MGFTRSETNVDVHKNMPDYPTNEGYTTEQLKTAFDSSAVGLKADLNGLMTELESTDAATDIGASPLTAGDTTGANVQAKLEKLQEELQNVALGDIPDGTITTAKLDDTLAALIALKDGTEQANLNADKLGGLRLAQIIALINSKGHVRGSFTVDYTNNPDGNYTLDLGFNPSFVIFIRENASYANVMGFPMFGIAIGNETNTQYKCLYYDAGASSHIKSNEPTATREGIVLKGFTTKSGDTTYTHNMRYVAFR
jgi:hypothetical protein